MSPSSPPSSSRTEVVPATAAAPLAKAILELVGHVPASRQTASAQPGVHADQLARAAARQAALAAGSLALPPGPLGWLTVLPELVTVWRIQARLVADIAGLYGQHAQLGREQMLYCLFKHTAAQAVRDLVVRAGERFLVQTVSSRVLQSVAQGIGLRVGRQVIGKGVSRWLPLVGAMGVGAYAYADTRQVARTAIEMFERGVITAGQP
ncbi:MAG: hypothetical protein EOP40_03135 [Rubrivivax sp.]|nr:MAG: hypothetical protein EOP40_03135 [Rubrivivax sp.]